MNGLVFILQQKKFPMPLTCPSIGTRSSSLVHFKSISLLSFSLNLILLFFSFRISIAKLFNFLGKFLISDLSLHPFGLALIRWRKLDRSGVFGHFVLSKNPERGVFGFSTAIFVFERRSKNLKRKLFLSKSSAGKLCLLIIDLLHWQTFCSGGKILFPSLFVY